MLFAMWVWLLLARAHDTFYALYLPHFFLLLYGKQERLFSTSGMQLRHYKKAYEEQERKAAVNATCSPLLSWSRRWDLSPRASNRYGESSLLGGSACGCPTHTDGSWLRSDP